MGVRDNGHLGRAADIMATRTHAQMPILAFGNAVVRDVSTNAANLASQRIKENQGFTLSACRRCRSPSEASKHRTVLCICKSEPRGPMKRTGAATIPSKIPRAGGPGAARGSMRSRRCTSRFGTPTFPLVCPRANPTCRTSAKSP
jgi:hypothetical protein